MSELSLVLLALGNASGDVSDNIIGIAAFSFAFLAVGFDLCDLQKRLHPPQSHSLAEQNRFPRPRPGRAR
jgi:hypothetical protein